jgi:hypothetical protein
LDKGFPQSWLRCLAFADSVDGSPIGADEPCEFSPRQMFQEGYNFAMEVIVGWVVVLGDDLMWLCVATGLYFVNVVGFFSDEPDWSCQVDLSSLEEAAVVSPAGLLVDAVELGFGKDPVFPENICSAIDHGQVGSNPFDSAAPRCDFHIWRLIRR